MMAGLGPNKQFTCDIPDCRQCFLSEDHLSPYLPRHDANSKMGLLPVDQTPTPTTIFRKCEEAGLLQALQVENPFEETFRKATEGIRSGSNLLELPLHLNAQESLNTPQVIIPGTTTENENNGKEPPIRIVSPDPDQLCLSLDPIQPSPIIRREADTSDGNAEENDHCSDAPVANNITSYPNTESTANSKVTQQRTDSGDTNRSVQVLLRMPDGKLVQLSTLPVEPVTDSGGSLQRNIPIIKIDAPPSESSDSKSALSLQTNMSLAKMKLKQALMANNCPAATAQSMNSNKVVRSSMGFQQTAHEVPPPLTQKSSTSGEEDADVRRRKFLERNRAAAMRCREKKKTWVQELERNSNEMLRTNQHLEKEIALLRSEVAHLKTLLLAHKDCSVTKALAQGQATLPGFITLPTPSSVPQSTQPQLVSIAQSVTAAPSTVVIQPPSVRPVLVLNDPRSKRRRHASGSDTLPSCRGQIGPVTSAKDQVIEPSTFVKTGSAVLTTTTPAPVIISNFVTTTPALLTPVAKQAFILPKTDGVGLPPPVVPTYHPWNRTEVPHEKMHSRTILPTNVIKVNPNVMDRDVEVIGVKAKSGI